MLRRILLGIRICYANEIGGAVLVFQLYIHENGHLDFVKKQIVRKIHQGTRLTQTKQSNNSSRYLRSRMK